VIQKKDLPMLASPLEKPYPITQAFGANPGDYARFGVAGHTGIDYGCPSGTPVLAAQEGKVVVVAFDPAGYGNFVMLVHAGGDLTSLYGHLSLSVVRVGDKVTCGEVIAYSGTTGNSTGPHLHFEVRQAGQSNNGYGGAIDPAPLFAAAPAAAPAQPLPVLGEQVTVQVAALNVRLSPGGLLLGTVAQGTQLQHAPGSAPKDYGGITWLPVVVWVATALDGQPYLK
jgi:murein DD-endopeptidase MepM/ murein hydrolase activator NlpD